MTDPQMRPRIDLYHAERAEVTVYQGDRVTVDLASPDSSLQMWFGSADQVREFAYSILSALDPQDWCRGKSLTGLDCVLQDGHDGGHVFDEAAHVFAEMSL